MTNDNLPTVSRRSFLVSTSVAAAVEALAGQRNEFEPNVNSAITEGIVHV